MFYEISIWLIILQQIASLIVKSFQVRSNHTYQYFEACFCIVGWVPLLIGLGAGDGEVPVDHGSYGNQRPVPSYSMD